MRSSRARYTHGVSTARQTVFSRNHQRRVGANAGLIQRRAIAEQTIIVAVCGASEVGHMRDAAVAECDQMLCGQARALMQISAHARNIRIVACVLQQDACDAARR